MSRYFQAVTGALNQAVTNVLRIYIEDSFISQTQLEGLSGVSQSQISKLFRGERRMTIDQLESICRGLGLSVVAVVAEAASNITRGNSSATD